MGSVAPRMGVAEPLRRPTASRGRKRPRAADRLVGAIRAACRRSRLRVNSFLFWLLFSGVWETLIFGTGDWFAFGEPFFVACLPQLTHCLGTGSCPNYRLSAVGLSYALETINYKLYDVDPTLSQECRG